MSSVDPLDEQKSVRLRQRLWGAAVLIALLVIFLPLLLDGSGSESQYRRVERLRAEPPRVLNEEGIAEPVQTIEQAPAVVETEPASLTSAETESVQVPEARQLAPAPAPVETDQDTAPLTAWVVQAGSFGDEANAIAVRDKLRRAGFPSFVTASDSLTPLFRVRVGPMINSQQAESTRNKVMRLLNREAIVVSYP